MFKLRQLLIKIERVIKNKNIVTTNKFFHSKLQSKHFWVLILDSN